MRCTTISGLILSASLMMANESAKESGPVGDPLSALDKTIRNKSLSIEIRLESIAVLMRSGSDPALKILRRLSKDTKLEPLIRNQAHAAAHRVLSIQKPD